MRNENVKCPVCGTHYGLIGDGMCIMHAVAWTRWLAENNGGTLAQFILYQNSIAIVGIPATTTTTEGN